MHSKHVSEHRSRCYVGDFVEKSPHKSSKDNYCRIRDDLLFRGSCGVFQFRALKVKSSPSERPCPTISVGTMRRSFVSLPYITVATKFHVFAEC